MVRERLRASSGQLYPCFEELLHGRRIRSTRLPQGPGPGAPTGGQLLAGEPRVDPRTATRHPTTGIGGDAAFGQGDPEQARHPIPLTAADTGAYRATDRGHGSTVSSADGSPAFAASDRMSMRHPVIRAARRAFCPSRPMASDN